MSQFVPNKDLLFYVFMKPRMRVLSGEGLGPDQVVKQADGSYRGQVFKCVAVDDAYVVGECIHGGYRDHLPAKPSMFARRDVEFAPVGPSVLAALEIDVK